MAIPPPPGAPKKKQGMGCLGCGCLILVVLALLLLGLIGGGGHLVYNNLTSPKPTDVPSFDAGDDANNATRQRMSDFQHDLQNNQAATFTLSADEINTLIAHNPDLPAANIHVFVTMNGDEAQVQFCAPTDLLGSSALKGRYFSGSVSLGLIFDPSAKTLNFSCRSIHFGKVDAPTEYLPVMATELNMIMAQALQKSDDGRNLLNNAKSIEIKDGQLVIETQ